MGEFLKSTPAQIVLSMAILAGLALVGFYLIGRTRNRRSKGAVSANELMSNFREMHGQGELSDEEFRTIKGMLADRVERELSDRGEAG